MDIQPWFEIDGFRDGARYAELTPIQRQQIESFREHGFFVLEDTGIDPATLDRANDALDRMDPASDYQRHGRLQDAWREFPPVGDLATTPRILQLLQTLYQRDPIPFQTLNFRTATQQLAHSDTIHFNTLPHGFMCGVWVALEDTDADNGPLFYYPGSQRLPVLHLDDLGLEHQGGYGPTTELYQRYEEKVAQLLQDSPYRPRQAHLKKGQALVWSANIFHGGSPLLDPARTRKSQVTHYYFPGCIYYTPLMSNPMQQRWMLRQVADIRTQRRVPTYQGLEQKRSLWHRLCRRLARAGGRDVSTPKRG